MLVVGCWILNVLNASRPKPPHFIRPYFQYLFISTLLLSALLPTLRPQFLRHAVRPAAYSLKHYISWPNECLRTWRLEASSDGGNQVRA